jgi:hypothetical protein
VKAYGSFQRAYDEALYGLVRREQERLPGTRASDVLERWRVTGVLDEQTAHARRMAHLAVRDLGGFR